MGGGRNAPKVAQNLGQARAWSEKRGPSLLEGTSRDPVAMLGLPALACALLPLSAANSLAGGA